MTELNIDIIVALIGALGAVTMIVAMIVLRLTLTRRLKKDLESSGQYWRSGTIDFDLINTALFGWACLIPRMHQWKNFRVFYENLDVRDYATGYERIIAFTMICGLVVFFFCGIWSAVLNKI